MSIVFESSIVCSIFEALSGEIQKKIIERKFDRPVFTVERITRLVIAIDENDKQELESYKLNLYDLSKIKEVLASFGYSKTNRSLTKVSYARYKFHHNYNALGLNVVMVGSDFYSFGEDAKTIKELLVPIMEHEDHNIIIAMLALFEIATNKGHIVQVS